MANLLLDPNLWDDAWPYTTPPPAMWNGSAYAVSEPDINSVTFDLAYIPAAPAPAPGDTFAGTITVSQKAGDTTPFVLCLLDQGDFSTIDSLALTPGVPTAFEFNAVAGSMLALASTATPGGAGPSFYYGLNATIAPTDVVADDSHNCECESDAENNETRGELRARLMSLLGYGAQAASPPPGMADLLNNFLDQAQRLLYRRLTQFGWIRFYRWPLVGGVYLYDLPDNVDACDRKLDPRKMKWVGIHKDGIWRELVQGIDPSLYSHDVTAQWPTRYEVRQCIEVWPKPQDDGGYLVIKGAFGLQRFTEDTDKTTVNSDLVFLQALANAKAHYRKPDARLIQDQAEVMLRGIVAGEHMTARYIPGRGRRTADPAFVYDWPQAIPPFGGL